MIERYAFQIPVTWDQKQYAINLADYSIENHHVKDIFSNSEKAMKRQREFRYTGTLGEVVFADAYQLPRPERSFGAVDGQDFGKDFYLDINETPMSIDIKSMQRKCRRLKGEYVLNIPSYQLRKTASLTNFYCCITFLTYEDPTWATFIGFADKFRIMDGTIGQSFNEGATRIREDGTSFQFTADTYEIMFKDFDPPFVTDHIRQIPGFRKFSLNDEQMIPLSEQTRINGFIDLLG